MNSLRISTILYSLFIISLFLKIRVYFVIMILIILFNFLFLKKIKLKKYQIFSILLIGYTIFSWFYTQGNEMKNLNTLKMILGFSYISVFENSFKNFNPKSYIIFWKKINKVLKILITLNFFQILFIYIKNNIPLLQIFYLKNSSMAYIINFNDVYMFVGNENKNIWSTKLGIIAIIYYFTQKHIIKERVNKKIIILSILTILLILSRTGILFLSIFLFLNILENISFNRKVVFFIPSIPFVYEIGNIFYKRILRINFNNMHDGGMTRLYNWNLFRLNYFKENYILGIGLGGTKKFLIKYNTILADGHMHNVILNILLELGMIGGILYFLLITNIFLESRKYLKSSNIVLFFPFFIVLMLQYMGYDNDVVAYFSFILLISYSMKRGRGYDNFISDSNNK